MASDALLDPKCSKGLGQTAKASTRRLDVPFSRRSRESIPLLGVWHCVPCCIRAPLLRTQRLGKNKSAPRDSDAFKIAGPHRSRRGASSNPADSDPTAAAARPRPAAAGCRSAQAQTAISSRTWARSDGARDATTPPGCGLWVIGPAASRSVSDGSSQEGMWQQVTTRIWAFTGGQSGKGLKVAELAATWNQ